MDETYTTDQVRDLINMVVGGIRVGGVEDRVFTLDEVADRTGWALSSLEEECRAGTIEHVKRGRRLGMTSRQIALLVARHRSGTTAAEESASDDDLSQVRSSTAQRGARRQGRSAA